MNREACSNCGMVRPCIRVKVRLHSAKSHKHDSHQMLPFCNQECARQTMFLQLDTRSTRESIARFMGGRPVTYAEFAALAPVEVVSDGSDRPEIGKSENMALPYVREIRTPRIASERVYRAF